MELSEIEKEGFNILFHEKEIIPKCSVNNRHIPNDLIRSALFNVSNKNIKRVYMKNKEIFSFGSTRIAFTGEELRQDDEDVLMAVIFFYSRNHKTEMTFSPYELMKVLDWPARTQYRDKLRECIERMSATSISIANIETKVGLSFSLIRKFIWKDEGGDNLKKWTLFFEPEFLSLFTKNTYTKIFWHQRTRLNPLAKWLHSYYSSHAKPYPVSIEKIQLACGSQTKQKKHFKENLKKALDELVQVGFLTMHFIGANNLIFVERESKSNVL